MSSVPLRNSGFSSFIEHLVVLHICSTRPDVKREAKAADTRETGSIEEGIPRRSFHWPVATAVKLAFRVREVRVRDMIVVKKAGAHHASVSLPAVENFISTPRSLS